MPTLLVQALEDVAARDLLLVVGEAARVYGGVGARPRSLDSSQEGNRLV